MLGLIVVAAVSHMKSSDEWPKLFWLWANDEDPVTPVWAMGRSRWWSNYKWFALRNAVANHKYLLKDEGEYQQWGYTGEMESRPVIEAGLTRVVRWRQRGWQFSYRMIEILSNTEYRERYIGWKIGSSVPGLGFALQNRKGKIGN